MNTKSILTSKTFWFNIIVVAIGILNMIGGYLQNGTVITVVGVIGIVLRTLTDKPVSVP